MLPLPEPTLLSNLRSGCQIFALNWHHQGNQQSFLSSLKISWQVNIHHTFHGEQTWIHLSKNVILFSLLRHTKSAVSKLLVSAFGMYTAAQMISSSQDLSLLFLSDSIHGKWILCWTVCKEEEDWEFELFLAKEQENGLLLLPVTLNTKQCKSTEFSNSSGCCVRENTEKKKKRLNLFPL